MRANKHFFKGGFTSKFSTLKEVLQQEGKWSQNGDLRYKKDLWTNKIVNTWVTLNKPNQQKSLFWTTVIRKWR